MLRVIELFSGIGAQAKALERIGKNYKIVKTCDWDANAIVAYWLIHNPQINLEKYDKISDEAIDAFLSSKTLSMDGKKIISPVTYKRLSSDFKRLLYIAIRDTHNMVSITDVKSSDIPDSIDVMTYSFPCQDLSACGYWHGNKSGISRDAHNRSGMLWEVERVLKEMNSENRQLPRFLVMENVTNILSSTHEKDFNDWLDTLNKLGYYNRIFRLSAGQFGVPQKRERAYMVSVFYGDNDCMLEKIKAYFDNNNLEKENVANRYIDRRFNLKNVLKLDYSKQKYKTEADACQPNDTPSRQKIWEENDILFDGKHINEMLVNTVTTKQDRNPNSGLIVYKNGVKGKSKWRYLTPRECFMLMGFDETDYDKMISREIECWKGKKLFTLEKQYRMAGNSICVNVIEAIFKQIDELKRLMKKW